MAKVFHPELFEGRVFGVTGAAHGIGEATADALLNLGAKVVVVDWNKDQLARVREKWKGYEKSLVLKFGDVGEDKVLVSAVNAGKKKFRRIDGWVSNAAANPFGKVESQKIEDFERGWRVNTLAAWRVAQLLLPGFRKQGGGSLVHVGSMLARETYPFNASYVTTKAALEGLTRALAVELAEDKVRVNAVVPGMVDTFKYVPHRAKKSKWRGVPGVPDEAIKRQGELRNNFRQYQWRCTQPWPDKGQPEDAANAILFLLSDAAAFVTGASLVVDGGMTVFYPRMMAMNLDGVAEDQKEIMTIGEQYPAIQLSHMLKYKNAKK